jgi:tripartite-type tricarboxylate transporter receptor subunit TctC
MLVRLAVFFLCFTSVTAHAQTAAQPWPQKTVRFIIPLPPGSGMDLSARLIAERLTQSWGQSVVVENRQGADGIPAVTAFLTARDDPKELVPLAPAIDNFLGVSASATLKVNTLAELVTAAKAQPGKLNYAATPGLPVFVLLALQRYAGIEMSNVPYRDFAPAYQDLATGRLHVASTGVPTLAPHHQAGNAKLLFVTNRERSPQARDVPTAAEAGYADLTFEGVSGIYGWRDMPAEIRRRVTTDVAAIVADPAFRTRVVGVGSAPRSGTPEEFAAAIEDQRARVTAIHEATAKR